MLAQTTGLVFLPENNTDTSYALSHVSREFMVDDDGPRDQRLDGLPDALETGFGAYLAPRSIPSHHASLAYLSSRLSDTAAATTKDRVEWAVQSRSFVFARTLPRFGGTQFTPFTADPFPEPLPSLFPL